MSYGRINWKEVMASIAAEHDRRMREDASYRAEWDAAWERALAGREWSDIFPPPEPK